MGTTFFTLGKLLASLHSLVRWLTQAPKAQCGAPQAHPAAAHTAALPARSSRHCTAGYDGHSPRRPLRVVRVVDAAHPPTGAGRMFMSGCMADVCAELDRLAALEAAAG